MAAILVGLAQAQQGTHQAHLHRWSERSVAAYLEHKEVFRAPRSGHKQQGGESVSYWDQFWPAFVCPWQDRVGRISEGGKWLCNWQALLSPPDTWNQKDKSAAKKTSEDNSPPCVIYSFGISKETSFEEALMARLHGRSNCQLWGFDPTVPGFPNNHIAGNPVFTKMGLNAKSVAKHGWPSKDLLSLMAERNHSHIDLLKVDIESSEWSLFDELCKGGPEVQPLPFDQLLIELHRVDASRMHKLVKCLDAHGLYPFAREENLHSQACTDHPTNSGIHDVEMSFVRAPSRFTQAPLHGQASTITAAPAAPAPSSSLLSMSSLLSSITSSSSSSSSTSSSSSSSSVILQPHDGAKRWASVLQNEAIAAREAFAKRGGMGGKGHPVGFGPGWEHMEAFRCSDVPYYLWDVFEPRAWCPDKQWVIAEWTSSSQPTTSKSARALCVPRIPSMSSSHRSGHRGTHAHRSSSHTHHGAGLLTGAASMEHASDAAAAGGAANFTCEVDVAGAAGASAVVQSDGASARDSDPFASPQPASPSFVASLAKGLGCSNTQVNNDTTTTTTSASASSADDTGSIYRVLAANIERASEWGSATAAACRGDLDRYDQLVLDLTLVGKDIVGAHASRRKQRDNTLVGGGSSKQRRQLSLRSSSSAAAGKRDFVARAMPFLAPKQQQQPQQRNQRLRGLKGAFSMELLKNESTRRLADADGASYDGNAAAKAWSRPAAASLSSLVHCLEDRGFRLAHRELLFRDNSQAAPPVHAAALTFVRGS